MSPTPAAGVALLGGVAFAAASRRAASRREELELQRRFRGELIRRRLKTAGPTISRREIRDRAHREVDYAGDRLMSARTSRLNARGVWSGGTKPSPGRKTWRFCETPTRNRRDADANGTRGPRLAANFRDETPVQTRGRFPRRFPDRKRVEPAVSYGTVRVTLA